MSAVVKRSLTIAGHRTSISLEEPFWRLLRMRAEANKITPARLVEEIDRARRKTNLSSAIRVEILHWLMQESDIRMDPQIARPDPQTDPKDRDGLG
jgi:predicted DNA-binding ribbon-helix-helix protein